MGWLDMQIFAQVKTATLDAHDRPGAFKTINSAPEIQSSGPVLWPPQGAVSP